MENKFGNYDWMLAIFDASSKLQAHFLAIERLRWKSIDGANGALAVLFTKLLLFANFEMANR